jgi:hypothetical protein
MGNGAARSEMQNFQAALTAWRTGGAVLKSA